MSAGISALAIISVVGWHINKIIQEKNTNLVSIAPAPATHEPRNNSDETTTLLNADVATSSSPDDIAQIGTNAIGKLATYYAIATQYTPYTPELGAQIVASVAPTVSAHVAYPTYNTTMIPTDANTSAARKAVYQTDIKTSLKPLMQNKTYELDLYNAYMHTRNPIYLNKLKTAAQNYRTAATETARIVTPVDAVSYQVGILNAMQEFAATLDALADNTDDPITSLALLKSYNQAESDMVHSFTALNTYFAHTQL
jgi:hypothetical protein